MKVNRDSQFIREVRLKEELILSYDTFPLTLPFMQHFGTVSFHPNLTCIIGENGMGKSTLLEGIAIALGFNPEGGSLNFSFDFNGLSGRENHPAYRRGDGEVSLEEIEHYSLMKQF